MDIPTFDPTFALVLKLPTFVERDEELTKEFTDELPTLIVDVSAVKFALPVEVTNVLFDINLDPTVKLAALTVPV